MRIGETERRLDREEGSKGVSETCSERRREDDKIKWSQLGVIADIVHKVLMGRKEKRKKKSKKSKNFIINSKIQDKTKKRKGGKDSAAHITSGSCYVFFFIVPVLFVGSHRIHRSGQTATYLAAASHISHDRPVTVTVEYCQTKKTVNRRSSQGQGYVNCHSNTATSFFVF